MKKVFVTAFHSFISKNILNTEAWESLSRRPDLELFLIVPAAKKEFYQQTYGNERIKIIGLNPEKTIGLRRVKFFSRLAYLVQESHYLHYKKIERREKRGEWKGSFIYRLEVLVTKLLGDKAFFRRLLRFTFRLSPGPREIKNLFVEISPDVVFSTDVFDENDTLILREASCREILAIGMVRSWDNCYSKGILRVVPDWLIVNNETLKEEVSTLHDVPAETIFVSGLPQFDAFLKVPRTAREIFCRQAGLDPSKPFAVFAPAGSILSETDWQIAEILKQAKVEGRLPDVQFLIRNHPNHPADFSNLKDSPDFVIESPGKIFNPNNPKETELTGADSQHLADTLYHCSLVIFIATTLGLDALVFNKPQIVIDFDGYEDKDYWHSVKRYHDEDHMKKMIACGGVEVASSKEELIKAVNKYLEDPSLDQKGRDRMLIQQLYKNDGLSGRRIAEFLNQKIPT